MMIHNTQSPQNKSIPMPITQEAQQIAIEFASEQPTQQKAFQVYLNTLAVCAVNNYLRILDVPTDLTAGDSWNPAVRLAADIADLWVTGLGRLECRPIQQDGEKKDVCSIPPGIEDERIGYVVVQIDLQQQEATLVGFSPTAATGELTISQLQPINNLLKHLESPVASPVIPINLSQWWRDIFEVGWQSVEAFLDAQTADNTLSQMAFRRSNGKRIRRGKLIKLGNQQLRATVALAVILTQQEANNFGISLQVFPQLGETYLPVGLKLAVLDESGTIFFESASENSDRLIQIPHFGGRSGERFRVRVSLGEDSLTEEFII